MAVYVISGYILYGIYWNIFDGFTVIYLAFCLVQPGSYKTDDDCKKQYYHSYTLVKIILHGDVYIYI